MVLSLRNRKVQDIKRNRNLSVEKLSRQDTSQSVKTSEISDAVSLKKKCESPSFAKNILSNTEALHCRKSIRRQILGDKTNNSDAESQVDDIKSKSVNSTPKSCSKTISPGKRIRIVGSKKKNSPQSHNKELCLKKQNCIYSSQAGKNESLKESEKYSVYEFEVDENDPVEKKRKVMKRRKKGLIQKKLGCTVEEEIRAKNKTQASKKFKIHKAKQSKAVKVTGPKDQCEIYVTLKKIEAKKTNTIVEEKIQEEERETSEKQISHLGKKSLAGRETLVTPLEEEQQNSVSECFSRLSVPRREMSPEFFNSSQFGFITSTAEKGTDINRFTVNLSRKISNAPQSKYVLQNTLQTPSGDKSVCPLVGNLNKKSKIPRELLSLFSPLRYDDISEEIEILSPIRAPSTTKTSTNLQQTNTSIVNDSNKQSKDLSVEETVPEIYTPCDTNLQKTISSNHGINKPSSCKQPEDFNISNCFGFDEEDSLPKLLPSKLDSAPSNKIKCVGELPRPFRANIVIPRRPLYPRINCKHTSKVEDQKQDTQNSVVGDHNVSIFDLEEEECAADTNATDAGPSCALREDKDTFLMCSPPQQSPNCYPVTKRLRPVRSKPIIEESGNDEEEEEPTLKRHKKSQKTKVHEKELNKWATSFNSMCEEVDSFELCFE